MAITLLGGFAIADASGAAVDLPTRKTALVLAVLVFLGDRGAARDALAEWVWPDRAQGQARTSLRQALHAIRKCLDETLPGGRLETDRERIWLSCPDAPVDVARFANLAGADDAAGRTEAATLYRGDLLADVTLTPALEDLIGPARESLRRRALDLVETMSAQATKNSAERAACEALANTLLAADPAAEAAHRALIRLRLDEGQTNAARRQLEICTAAIARELGAEPEEQTLALLATPQMPPVGAAAPRPEALTAPTVHVEAESRRRPGPSVVVMPFDDLGPDRDDFLVDGVVEEITSALSRVRDFFVIARQSAYTYKGRFVDAREVGRDLGVRYAVEGTVRRGGDRVRLTVQLVETETGTQLWSERYEGETGDLFALQDRIASHVAGAINPSIRAGEIEIARRKPPENLEAYDLVLRGLPHFWVHRKADNRDALRWFDRALARDPDYGVALAFKAWCHAQEAAYGWSDDPGQDRAFATEYAQRAARQVSDHATALVGIGAALTMASTDHELAQSFIARALALDPNNAWGWMRSGWLKVLFGLRQDALQNFEKALELSPFDPFAFNIYFGMALAHAEEGDFDAAVAMAERGLRAGAGVTWAYRMLAAFHALAGNTEQAAQAVRTYLHHYPGITLARMRQGMPPGLVASNPKYWEGMRLAGIPEE